jgi:hypothetical protein
MQTSGFYSPKSRVITHVYLCVFYFSVKTYNKISVNPSLTFAYILWTCKLFDPFQLLSLHSSNEEYYDVNS